VFTATTFLLKSRSMACLIWILLARGETRNTYLFSFSLNSDAFSVSWTVWMRS
jgi:hypothetical protein